MQENQLMQDTVEFVKGHMISNDASHDWSHIMRVRKLANYIANKENLSDHKKHVVELAALMHDIDDWKYKSPSTVGGANDNEHTGGKVMQFLRGHSGCSISLMNQVLHTVGNVGFRDELRGNTVVTQEIACVQDADRLDAIGAIGVARACIFGAAKGREFYTPNKDYNIDNHSKMTMTFEEYNKGCDTPTLDHFFDKLIFLKDMMKTQTGSKLAEKKHAFMLEYLKQVNEELKF
jgi:uncharacterized protein